MSVTVAQITDFHLLDDAADRLHGLDPDATLKRVLEAVGELAPDLIVASGDLTENAGSDAYRRLRVLLSDAPAPVACLPGNHDDAQRMAEALCGEGVTCPAGVSLDGWRLCLLDSTVPGRPWGRVGESRLAELDWQLHAHARKHKLVFVHHQPVDSGSPWIDGMGLTDGEALLERLEADPRAVAVACGHIHHPFHARAGRLEIFGTPATSFQARPGRRSFELDTDNGPGFRWFRLFPDGLMDTGITRIAPGRSS